LSKTSDARSNKCLRFRCSGVIFSTTSEGNAERKAFELAVDHVNNDVAILPSTQLKYIVSYTASLHPLSSVQKGKDELD
jgi:hypothetical protein